MTAQRLSPEEWGAEQAAKAPAPTQEQVAELRRLLLPPVPVAKPEEAA